MSTSTANTIYGFISAASTVVNTLVFIVRATTLMTYLLLCAAIPAVFRAIVTVARGVDLAAAAWLSPASNAEAAHGRRVHTTSRDAHAESANSAESDGEPLKSSAGVSSPLSEAASSTCQVSSDSIRILAGLLRTTRLEVAALRRELRRKNQPRRRRALKLKTRAEAGAAVTPTAAPQQHTPSVCAADAPAPVEAPSAPAEVSVAAEEQTEVEVAPPAPAPAAPQLLQLPRNLCDKVQLLSGVSGMLTAEKLLQLMRASGADCSKPRDGPAAASMLVDMLMDPTDFASATADKKQVAFVGKSLHCVVRGLRSTHSMSPLPRPRTLQQLSSTPPALLHSALQALPSESRAVLGSLAAWLISKRPSKVAGQPVQREFDLIELAYELVGPLASHTA